MEPITYRLLKTLDKKLGAPFYIMEPEKYRRNINSFLNAFKQRYAKVVAGYSFKTNYVPALCLEAKQLGCYAEVVSEMELDLALALGFENIIFNGPIKRDTALIRAISTGSIINVDSEYEVDFLCQYHQCHPTEEIKVGLRLNVMLTDQDGNSVVQNGLRCGRFGLPYDILKRNIKKLKEAGVGIISVHGHTSSSDRAVINYKVICDYMLRICEEFGLNAVKYFDIGGGYFGAAPEGFDITGRPQYKDYANIVIDSVEKSKWFRDHNPFIVIEPGSSVVSNVFNYYTKVYQIKHMGEKNFVMVDGTVFDVKPTMHPNNLPYSVISDFEGDNDDIYDVVGSTCMEKDIILKDVSLKGIKEGDFLEIRGVGAYTICLTPTFINYLPPIVSIENKEEMVVRRRQRLDDILTIYER